MDFSVTATRPRGGKNTGCQRPWASAPALTPAALGPPASRSQFSKVKKELGKIGSRFLLVRTVEGYITHDCAHNTHASD